MTIRTRLIILLAASMALLAACATDVQRGHLKEDEAIGSVKPGITTKDEVQKLLGSPSSESTFGQLTWLYVSSIRKTRSILPPKITDQHVIEISFDANGTVNKIKQYTMADKKDVEVATETTPTEGQKLGFFEQVLSNLGRFNNNDNGEGISNSHTHGNPTPGYPGR